MIEFKTGNLFMSDCEALGHGCNAQGLSGAGIILQFKEKFPLAIHTYQAACARGEFKPGDVLPVKSGGKIIVNMGTQAKIKRGNTGGASLVWIRQCLEKIRDNDYGFKSIAFPKVGGSLGGLDWRVVRLLFIEIFQNCPLRVEVYE